MTSLLTSTSFIYQLKTAEFTQFLVSTAGQGTTIDYRRKARMIYLTDDGDESPPSQLSLFFLGRRRPAGPFCTTLSGESGGFALRPHPPPLSCSHLDLDLTKLILFNCLKESVFKACEGGMVQIVRQNGEHMCPNNELTWQCTKMKLETSKYTPNTLQM